MKRFIKLILIICAAAVVLAAGAGLLTRQVLIRQIRTLLGADSVHIASCSFWQPGRVRISGIEIKRTGIRISVDQVNAQYSLLSLVTLTIPAVTVSNAAVAVSAPLNKLGGLPLLQTKKTARPRFKVKKVHLRSCRFNSASADLRCEAEVSAGVALDSRTVTMLQVRIPRLDRGELHLRDVFLKADTSGPGEFAATEISFGNLRLSAIRGNPAIRARELVCTSLEAAFLSGRLTGRLLVSLAIPPVYSLTLKAFQLDLTTFVNEFKLAEKMHLSGMLEGSCILNGRLLNFNLLEGGFVAAEPGGVLIIRDRRLLQTIADSAHQPVEVIAGSFQDYRYDTAVLRLNTVDDQLILTMRMNGAQGKRELTAVLHDFKTKGGR
ncbi:MAG TPA: hypothetical protein PLF03_00005 [Candidatus Omnitrophota bacterium]|nr:hypothetical protein [Candidatus Omnitrophota bacterium]